MRKIFMLLFFCLNSPYQDISASKWCQRNFIHLLQIDVKHNKKISYILAKLLLFTLLCSFSVCSDLTIKH